jgi:hypothetical protein
MPSEVLTVDINPTLFYIPPRVGGDREFKGHGPRVDVSARLSIRNARELWATVYMHAKETQSDWTEVEGTADYLVYKHPMVTRILRIVSDTYSFSRYVDTDHEVDYLDMPAGELVRQFECVGDTSGEEAGLRTGVRVHFNPIRLEIEPTPIRHDRPIAEIVSATYAQASYTDTDHADDDLTLGADDLVARFVCTGDTGGNEAGTRTGVVVHFNPIVVREA